MTTDERMTLEKRQNELMRERERWESAQTDFSYSRAVGMKRATTLCETAKRSICQILLPRYKNVQLIAKGVFVPVSSLPQREPMKGVQTA